MHKQRRLTEERGRLALTQLCDLLSPLLFILHAHLLNGSHNLLCSPLSPPPFFLHHMILLYLLTNSTTSSLLHVSIYQG